MRIRAAKREDLPALLEIYNAEVLQGTATFDLETKTPEQWEQWFEAHQGAGRLLLTAEMDGCAVGYATLSQYRDRKAYDSTAEVSVYVAANCRRQGVATALMEQLLSCAQAEPQLHLHLLVSVITGENEKSCRLHEKFGFVHSGTLPEVGRKFDRWLSVETYYRKLR